MAANLVVSTYPISSNVLRTAKAIQEKPSVNIYLANILQWYRFSLL